MRGAPTLSPNVRETITTKGTKDTKKTILFLFSFVLFVSFVVNLFLRSL